MIFTLNPIFRSSHSWEQPLSLLFRHSLMKQFSSSVPSPQSSLRLHSNVSLMHLPFPHAYAVSLHFFSAWRKKERIIKCMCRLDSSWGHAFQSLSKNTQFNLVFWYFISVPALFCDSGPIPNALSPVGPPSHFGGMPSHRLLGSLRALSFKTKLQISSWISI